MATKHDMKALLGKDFFKEEARCDYLVSAKMKRIWAVLMDMYLAFAEICEKHGLKYCVMGGTLLGAIRHNGFIPWDDDIDVLMMREDYNKFLEVAPKELDSPLTLQTPYTDNGYYGSAAKIRNSSTAAICDVLKHNKFNQGLFIDVFPMDFCDPQTIAADTFEINVLNKKNGAYMRRGSLYLNERQKQDEITYYTDNPFEVWNQIQQIASNSKYYNSGYLCNTVYTGDSYTLRMHPANCYSEMIDHKFEGITVKIPVGYDEILSIMYGNYMEFPTIEMRGERHSVFIFDPDKSYSEYL